LIFILPDNIHIRIVMARLLKVVLMPDAINLLPVWLIRFVQAQRSARTPCSHARKRSLNLGFTIFHSLGNQQDLIKGKVSWREMITSTNVQGG
jgi:hypothetical protein